MYILNTLSSWGHLGHLQSGLEVRLSQQEHCKTLLIIASIKLLVLLLFLLGRVSHSRNTRFSHQQKWGLFKVFRNRAPPAFRTT